MRAEAYRSMADERGQVWQLQAAVWQVLVDRESRRRARIVAAIDFKDGEDELFSEIEGHSATRECFLCH